LSQNFKVNTLILPSTSWSHSLRKTIFCTEALTSYR